MITLAIFYDGMEGKIRSDKSPQIGDYLEIGDKIPNFGLLGGFVCSVEKLDDSNFKIAKILPSLTDRILFGEVIFRDLLRAYADKDLILGRAIEAVDKSSLSDFAEPLSDKELRVYGIIKKWDLHGILCPCDECNRVPQLFMEEKTGYSSSDLNS